MKAVALMGVYSKGALDRLSSSGELGYQLFDLVDDQERKAAEISRAGEDALYVDDDETRESTILMSSFEFTERLCEIGENYADDIQSMYDKAVAAGLISEVKQARIAEVVSEEAQSTSIAA